MQVTARLVLVTIVALGITPTGALSQIRIQPTAPPTTVADNESWYQAGEPIFFAGNVYYPAGPVIHFLPNEMVLSGLYRAVPLYSRTTIEPYSVVFVPLSGGLMKSYERQRAGDLAGTTGSSVPSLPVEIPTSFTPTPRIQAAGPPFVETQTAVGATTREDPLTGSRVQTSVEPLLERSAVLTNSQGLGTAGRVSSSRSRNGRVDRDVKNGMFVEFNHTRWYASAPPQSIDPARLRPIGDWHGFPVYTAPSTGESTIYIPIALGVDALAAYSRRK